MQYYSYVYFKWWPFGIGKPTDKLLLWESYFSYSQHHLVACSCLVSLGKTEASLTLLWSSDHICMFIGIALVHLLFRKPCCWDSVDDINEIPRRDIFMQTSWFYVVHKSFLPIFFNVPWTLDVGIFCRCIHWNWTSQLFILTGYDFLE